MSAIRRKVDALNGGPFELRAAVTMAAAIDDLVRRGVIDARSPAADARMSFGDGVPDPDEDITAILMEGVPGSVRARPS